MTDRELGETGPDSRVAPGAIYTPLLRSYEDAPELDRVWERLDARRRAPRASARLALAAVVLLGLGFGLGRTSQSWSTSALGELRAPRQVAIAPETRGAAPLNPLIEATPRDDEKLRAPTVGDTARSRPLARAAAAPEPEPELVELPLPNESETTIASWSRLAERGDYAGAFEILDETGELNRLLGAGDAEELMALADVARFAGRTGWAIQILREVTSRHSEDENAPLAAMTLGNLLDRAGDFEGASRAYSLCRRLAPYGDFAEDALVREFMMACGAGERARASRLLAEYSSLHPGGAREEEMAAALALLGDSAPPSPGAERDIWGDEGSLPSELGRADPSPGLSPVPGDEQP